MLKTKKISIVLLSVLLLISAAGCVSTKGSMPESVPAYDIPAIINELPGAQVWIDHLNRDLLPFWTMEDALGDPAGNFPTYRANDGSLVDPANLPPEYKAALASEDTKGLIMLNRNYVRAQARQTFAYCIAYHMTGNEDYLKLAKKGVDFLRENAVDRINDGGAYSYYLKDSQKWEPDVLQRTSQDMAYALSGIGLFYYLTRDPELLPDILAIKDHIFSTYYDPELDLLRWVITESPDGDSPDQKELVSQLDQVYGYMLWLTPSLPAEKGIQAAWKNDLEHLARIMVEQFFSPEYRFFWGQITQTSYRHLGADHTDFGHSIKTLWLIYRIGLYTGNLALVEFARNNATRLINIAYIEKTGSWARGFDKDGKLNYDKEWWSLAELDQTTATLGMNDPSLLRYLPHTYEYWFNYMVDKEHGGVWHMVSAENNEVVLRFPKVHSWKNSFHTFEHALIGYMTTCQIKNEPIILYYAFKNPEDTKDFIHPYFFSGKYNEDDVDVTAFSELSDYNKVSVSITDLR